MNDFETVRAALNYIEDRRALDRIEAEVERLQAWVKDYKEERDAEAERLRAENERIEKCWQRDGVKLALAEREAKRLRAERDGWHQIATLKFDFWKDQLPPGVARDLRDEVERLQRQVTRLSEAASEHLGEVERLRVELETAKRHEESYHIEVERLRERDDRTSRSYLLLRTERDDLVAEAERLRRKTAFLRRVILDRTAQHKAEVERLQEQREGLLSVEFENRKEIKQLRKFVEEQTELGRQ